MIRNLFILFVSVVFLASCSNQRFGHISKVKVDQQASKKEAVKRNAATTQQEARVDEQEEIALSQEDQVVALTAPALSGEVVVVPEQNTTSNHQKAATSKKDARREWKKGMKAVKGLASTSVSEKFSILKDQIKGKTAIKDADNAHDYPSNTWVRLLIVGLVLVLLGILLPDPIGYIFYLVGGIILIFALVLLLLSIV